jgi:hypothetical protein
MAFRKHAKVAEVPRGGDTPGKNYRGPNLLRMFLFFSVVLHQQNLSDKAQAFPELRGSLSDPPHASNRSRRL